MWPTPTSRDYKDIGDCSNVPNNYLLGRVVKPSKTEGSLNPDWVETLMGIPVGWTDPACNGPKQQPFPAPLGCEQYHWEPPYLATRVPNRVPRLKALGNAVVPALAEVLGRILYTIHQEVIHTAQSA